MNHASKNTKYKHKRQIRLDIIAQSALLLLKESFCNISSQRRTTTTIMQAGNVETPRTKTQYGRLPRILDQTNS